MRGRFDLVVSVLAVLVAALMSVFLGFSQCGGYLWVERVVFGAITALVLATIAYRMARLSSGSLGRRFVSKVLFGLGAIVALVFAFKVGEALYMLPHSLSEWLALGC